MSYELLLRGGSAKQARRRILDAYDASAGSTSGAADHLGVHKTTLLRAIRRLGMSREVAERWPSPIREAYALIAADPAA